MIKIFIKGLAAVLLNKNLERETLILGLKRLLEGHSAEKVQKAIEEIVKSYDFDKNKIRMFMENLFSKIYSLL